MSVALTTLLLSGTGCASSVKVIGDPYVDNNGNVCFAPETLKSLNIAIQNHPKKKILVDK